jgi:hypothetical protein
MVNATLKIYYKQIINGGISMLTLAIFFGGQIMLGSIAGWELGKKFNNKLLGNKSPFASKDSIIVTHKKWNDIK